ncbi:ankyrin-3 [Elysia marginata]|uniref:Ankyrin-3 n=1 Tax=Elysia marginata TaxID=1093978 RepID=A0AAV4FIB2_9GAST|nr:ankyrin-3 [Elysia marginata]
MSSNEVVKSVAKKLKYYFEVKRLEDGFDLSDIHQPQLDHPPLKSRPALQYDGLHDRALKHYFSQPEVRVQLTQLNTPNAKGSLHSRRELQVRRLLDSYMKHYTFQRSPLPSCYYLNSARGDSLKPEVTGVLHRRKKKRAFIGGWPTLRSVPDHPVSKGEATRLVNSATKILVASAVVENLDPHPRSARSTQSAPRSFENGVYASSKRPATAKTSRRKKLTAIKPKAYDDIYIERRVRQRSAEPRARSPTPSQTTTATNTTTTATSMTSTTEEKPAAGRPRSAKYRSRTIINVTETRPHEEVAVIRATQTVADYDVAQETDRQILEKFDKLEEEVTDGPWCEYQIYVCTGSRIGASTKAAIKLTMYGEKGRTKEFILNDSKRHKIPFQKGREDLFILPAHHIGRIRKIQIGHDRPELSYAWYLEGVTVYDMHGKRIFQFPCERWLSGQDGDKRTYRMLQVDRERDFIDGYAWYLEGVTVYDMHGKRIFQFPCERWLSGQDGDKRTYRMLQVDRERDFIDALNDSMSKSPRGPLRAESAESDSSATLKNETLRYKLKGQGVKGRDNYSTEVRAGDAHSDSTSSGSSSDESSGSESSRAAKVPVRDERSSPRHKKGSKKPPPDDYDVKARTGPVITLHSGPDSQQVDEIFMDPRGKEERDKAAAEDFLLGYKTAVTASEEEKKRALTREREVERAMLQGKSIHDAVRDGDLDRVKDLLHHFPEMRDFRDESSWTPIHLAASRGDVAILRWLITSDADTQAETSTGYTAMQVAAMNGHVNAMILLQAMGASIQGQTADGHTALHLAAKNGHLECVKWLVANRASLTQEDTFGRSPLQLAQEFSRDACADFLRVCLKELSNPRSTFAQMHGIRMAGAGLPPIEEDTASASSGPQWKDDVAVKGRESSSDSEDEKEKSQKEEKELEEKRKIYKEHQQRMKEKDVSFLDSIRQEQEQEG